MRLNTRLDCQGCGELLEELSQSEARKVAERPYDFVGFCATCKRDGLHIEQGFR